MNNDEIKELSLALLKAESEDEAINVLERAGYWHDKDAWRLYGDKEGNFAQAGNQAALPEAALVEKIVNSVDARLMNECLEKGIDPESDAAPKSIRDAIATFFEGGRRAVEDEAGTISNWPAAKRREHSAFITVAATGARPERGRRRQNMCITIADQGEGQSPERLPRTVLSLNEKNKQCIRFVQGKFNMGGSGALRFCGQLGLQLVISRRNPVLAENERGKDSSVGQWGLTVVRREKPSNKSGEPVHSEFTYLAPLGAKGAPRKGGILRFAGGKLPLMPEHDEAYVREVEWATVIKLYEYETTVGQSHILMPDGLLYALERLLPEIALPVSLHECRGYKGAKERSFETPLAGLSVRLEEGKGDNLEPRFPLTAHLQPAGMRMKARIYAFKEDKASTYLKDEGVIFAVNGQAHGHLPKSLFSRPKAVGLPRLKESLLVLVDCSGLDAIQREDLFMSSRDRLSKKPIRYTVEREVEEMLRTNSVLRELQQERKHHDVESTLSEEKPLEEVLGKVLRASPTLHRLFLQGQRLSRPFLGRGGGKGQEKNGPSDGNKAYEGLRHPTYFKIAKCEYGKLYVRNCEKDRRCRISFQTDVENGYFDRPTDRGRFELDLLESPCGLPPLSYSLSLEDGEAHLSLALPSELDVGDRVVLQASVFDPTLQEPFVNVLEFHVHGQQPRSGGSKRTRTRGFGGGKGDRASTQGISLPHIEPVRENDSHWQKYKFTPDTACHVISDPVEVDGKTQLEHTFYINLDNLSLRTEMKYSKQDARLLEAKFKYGNVLLGLAMLHDAWNSNKEDETHDSEGSETGHAHQENGEVSVQDRIRRVSGAVAPVLLPMIDHLGGLTEGDLEAFSELGDDE